MQLAPNSPAPPLGVPVSVERELEIWLLGLVDALGCCRRPELSLQLESAPKKQSGRVAELADARDLKSREG